MSTLILTQPEIRALLPMQDCIELMAEALSALARDEALNPLRRGMRLSDGKSLIAMMPGEITPSRAVGLKVIAFFPGNESTPYDTHQGIVALFDAKNGVPRAILQASEITAVRTAAVSGLATRTLAREDAHDLALLGCGVQAKTHLAAVKCVRKLRRVRVYSPDRAHREAFAAHESKRHGLRVEAVDSARAAVEGADIICTVTSSRIPVVEGDWIAPGAHVNAVGSSFKDARELDARTVARSRLFTDRTESLMNEGGDFLIARSEGAVGDDHLQGEIGEVLIGKKRGRTSASEVTLFKSLGLAIEDLAAASYLDKKARELGIGTLVELGGMRREQSL